MTKKYIKDFLSLDNYATDDRSDRRKGSGGTQEFFTNYDLMKKMCDKLSPDTWTDFTKTILEPSAGNYQFVCYCLYLRLLNCKTQNDCQNAISTIYSVELLSDNVAEGKERLYKLIESFNFKVTNEIKNIINHNNVCSDFFKWDYENWRQIEEKKCNALF